MSASPPARKKSIGTPARERRAAPDAKSLLGPLRRLTSLMRRPLALARRNGKWRIVFVDRRRAVTVAAASAEQNPLELLRTELHARLMEYAPDDAAQVMHHLLLVHEALGRTGWAGVEALPAPVLGQAMFQAQMLHRRQPAPVLAQVIEKLRPLLLAADGRVQRDMRQRDVVGKAQLEISEASREEFEETERSWFGNLPPAQAEPHERRK